MAERDFDRPYKQQPGDQPVPGHGELTPEELAMAARVGLELSPVPPAAEPDFLSVEADSRSRWQRFAAAVGALALVAGVSFGAYRHITSDHRPSVTAAAVSQPQPSPSVMKVAARQPIAPRVTLSPAPRPSHHPSPAARPTLTPTPAPTPVVQPASPDKARPHHRRHHRPSQMACISQLSLARRAGMLVEAPVTKDNIDDMAAVFNRYDIGVARRIGAVTGKQELKLQGKQLYKVEFTKGRPSFVLDEVKDHGKTEASHIIEAVAGVMNRVKSGRLSRHRLDKLVERSLHERGYTGCTARNMAR